LVLGINPFQEHDGRIGVTRVEELGGSLKPLIGATDRLSVLA
jgi:hypothetical protein